MVAPDEAGHTVVIASTPPVQGYISHVMPNSGGRAMPGQFPAATGGPAVRGSAAPAENGAEGEEAEGDGKERPPYSYARLAVMAISSLGGRAKVVEIYSWIQEQYPYYKNGTQYWKNCIRHNLSIKKFFQRSGPYWYYLPELDDMLESRKGSKQSKGDGAPDVPPMMMRAPPIAHQNHQSHHLTQLQLQAQMEQQQRYIDQHISRLQAMAQEREGDPSSDGQGVSSASGSAQSAPHPMPMGMPMGQMPMGQMPMGQMPMGGQMRPGMGGMPGQPVMMMPGMHSPHMMPASMAGGVPREHMMQRGPMGQVVMDASGRQYMAMPPGPGGFGVPHEEAWSSLHQAAEILTNPAAREAYDQWRKSGVLLNKDDLKMRSRNPPVYKYDPSQQYDGMPLVPATSGVVPSPMTSTMEAPRARKVKSGTRPARKGLVKMSSDASRPDMGERLKRFQTDGPSGTTKLRRVDSDGGSFLNGPAQALVPRSRPLDADRDSSSTPSSPSTAPTPVVQSPASAKDTVTTVADKSSSAPLPVPMDQDAKADVPTRRLTFGPKKPKIGFVPSTSALLHFRDGGKF